MTLVNYVAVSMDVQGLFWDPPFPPVCVLRGELLGDGTLGIVEELLSSCLRQLMLL